MYICIQFCAIFIYQPILPYISHVSHIGLYWSISVSTCLYWTIRRLIYASLYSSVLVSINLNEFMLCVYQFIIIYMRLCQSILVYTYLCWSIVVYTCLRQSMLNCVSLQQSIGLLLCSNIYIYIHWSTLVYGLVFVIVHQSIYQSLSIHASLYQPILFNVQLYSPILAHISLH